mmetsp:Transcript_129783/g.225550  ORF Transcript_129783/g.225550 Transcript_129783/m.225550 type:complete len:389 (-) Transcript_129783:58-1224(-)
MHVVRPHGSSALAVAFHLIFWLDLHLTLAWDKDGHEAIGMTTMSALQNGPTAQVKRLMGGKDAVDVAAWAHKVNKKYPWTSELHFQKQPPATGKCGGANLTYYCPDNRCLVNALKHFYGRLVGKDYPPIDWGTGVKLTDADCVKYLITLIGDLHQPLHLGFEDSDMGRNFTVLFRDKQMSLYELWDKALTQAVMAENPGFWWGGWTHVQRTRTEYEKDNGQWKQDGMALFDTWADESAKFACEDIYKNPITGKLLSEEAKNGVFRVEPNLYEAWKREMFSKMLVAGARTAIVLNSILQLREAGNLHSGTAVKEIEEEEEHEVKLHATNRRNQMPKGHQHVQGLPALGYNVGIFGSVLMLFLYLMRCWQGRDTLIQDTKAKSSGSGKKI